jgi:hypothetical protein
MYIHQHLPTILQNIPSKILLWNPQPIPCSNHLQQPNIANQQDLEREGLPRHHSCLERNEDGGIISSDTSSASHQPLMLMPS